MFLLCAIVCAIAQEYCHPIVDWLRLSSTKTCGYDQPYPLVIPRPTSPLVGGYFICHLHNILVLQLPGRYLSFQRAQVSLIVSHIGEVSVELHRNHKDKARIPAQT